MPNKPLFFLKKADKIAKNSKDQSTKVGSFIVDEDGISPVGFGYNGMPRGLPDEDPIKNERPEKYLWTEHAERNAIYNSAQQLMENSIIFLSHFPNMEAVRAIVSSGIQTIVLPNLDKNHEHYSRVLEMLTYSKVDLISLEDKKSIILQDEVSPKMKSKYSSYMELTQEYGEDLSDEHCVKKEGALIMNKKTLAPIAMGAEGPPPNLKVDSKRFEKEGPSFWIQEAAKNAIFNAVRPKLKNCTAYVSWCPCGHCALALASVGIKNVVTYQPDFNQEADLRWKESFERAGQVFKSLEINLDLVDKEQVAQISKPKGIKR
jgi:dCMP deaminase